MKPCFFSFEDGTQFPGYDDGTTWDELNGWANVSVEKPVLDSIIQWNTELYGDDKCGLDELTADENGLYHLNGYMVTIEKFGDIAQAYDIELWENQWT
jgi:hypothetical protein